MRFLPGHYPIYENWQHFYKVGIRQSTIEMDNTSKNTMSRRSKITIGIGLSLIIIIVASLLLIPFPRTVVQTIGPRTIYYDRVTDTLGDSVGLGWGLGTLNVRDVVKLKVKSAPYKVMVCLDKRFEKSVGWREFNFAINCVERDITDEGEYEWVIFEEGNYSVIIGKLSGYLYTSFIAEVMVLQRPITQTTTVTKPIIQIR